MQNIGESQGSQKYFLRASQSILLLILSLFCFVWQKFIFLILLVLQDTRCTVDHLQ